MKFIDMNLDSSILDALEILGYEKMMEVQERVIPEILKGHDCIVQSKTGSGKTAAYALPILQNLKINERSPQALVLVPTRELAQQVQESFNQMGIYKMVKTLAIYGKVPFQFQKEDLKQRCHVIVGTPGRILDHLNNETFDTSKIKTCILDESDEMLNMDFLDDVQTIMDRLPKEKTTCLFSATLPEEIKNLSKQILKHPKMINCMHEEIVNSQVNEVSYRVAEEDKLEFLEKLIVHEMPESCIIFLNMQSRVQTVYEHLKDLGMSADQIHGGMEQEERFKAMKRFKEGRTRILVATDIVARGIDVEKIQLIINYDMPSPVEQYAHRIGRSGRVNEQGKAINFLYTYDSPRIEKLEEFLQRKLEAFDKTEIENEELTVEKLEKLSKSDRKIENKSKKLRKDIMKLYINIGKSKKIRAGDIVGAICQIEGIKAEDIGVIQIQDHQTYVDIVNGKGRTVLNNLKKIKSKPVRVQKAKN